MSSNALKKSTHCCSVFIWAISWSVLLWNCLILTKPNRAKMWLHIKVKRKEMKQESQGNSLFPLFYHCFFMNCWKNIISCWGKKICFSYRIWGSSLQCKQNMLTKGCSFLFFFSLMPMFVFLFILLSMLHEKALCEGVCRQFLWYASMDTFTTWPRGKKNHNESMWPLECGWC